MSVNQMAGQIKLNETWKSMKTDAIQMQRNVKSNETRGINLRPGSRRELNQSHRLKVAKSSFRVDPAKLWNVPTEHIAKREITKFSKTLSI